MQLISHFLFICCILLFKQSWFLQPDPGDKTLPLSGKSFFSRHTCTFDWNDKIVHFCHLCTIGGFTVYAGLRCLSHVVKLLDPVIYLPCCRGEIHWIWWQQLSGTNQSQEGATGPFPPVMICIFGSDEFVIENPTLSEILHRLDCSELQKKKTPKNKKIKHIHTVVVRRSKHTLYTVPYCILVVQRNDPVMAPHFYV